MGRRQQQRQSLGGQDDGEDVMITSADACDRLGLSDTWLRKLAEEGVITKQGYRTTTRYPWPKIRVQYFAYRENLLLEGLAGGKERKDLAEAEMAELKLARERGQLVTLAYMEAEVSRILVARIVTTGSGTLTLAAFAPTVSIGAAVSYAALTTVRLSASTVTTIVRSRPTITTDRLSAPTVQESP